MGRHRCFAVAVAVWAAVMVDVSALRYGHFASAEAKIRDVHGLSSCPTRRISVVAKPPLAEGLFGMVFERVLQLLPKASALQGVEMKFFPASTCYGDVLAAYFTDKVANASASCTDVEEQQVTFEEAFSKGWAAHADDLHSFSDAHAMWDAHFSLAKTLQDEVDASAQAFPTDVGTLGVHFRGTDKYLEARPVDAEDMWTLVEDYVAHSDEIGAIFVATDDATFANLALSRVKNLTSSNGHEVKLFLNHAVRSSDGHAVHKESCSNPALAKEALKDMLLLSRCDIVLKTSSQLSAWAKVFNPSLEIYRVNAFYQRWFPDSAIPLYAPSGASRTVNSLLASLQHGEGQPDAANSPVEALLPASF